MIEIGPFEICSVVTGTIRLDGGAMFGVVPKVMWEKVCDVDEFNRIALATRTLVAVHRKAARVILVDTGCGTKWTPKKASRFAIRYDPQAVPDALARVGLDVSDVTDVVITHLHFDHNGGLTEWVDDPEGPTCLRYPKARHWIHREHWEHAQNPHVKDQASFLREDFAVLADADTLCFVEGVTPDPPFEGLTWRVSHGHTPAQLHPLFEGNDRRLLFVGDIIPTVAHLRLPWVMAYDLLPMTTIREKDAFCREGIDQSLLLAFPHDPKIGGVRIEGTVQRPIVAEVLSLASSPIQ